ncbi:MAG: tRNA (N6-threonylcarbamoyladenosine(37)-N6)-methyltransferase TrmO [Clostridia bacterium]|nr:tRNA (N6-threonylcarbamoyladenosine(37)-N6)-methyltransferase TrmO [Clostridia bacterium]
MKEIAHIYTDFPTKFGIPRQSGLIDELVGKIVFTKEYRDPQALRGLEEFSHLWLIWEFSENLREGWTPTVRPPRLGGNKRVGVFATRSPFRPNPIGLSCVKLIDIKHEREGTVLYVSGADLMNGTPIYDIKPYIPLTDCKPEATEGYTTHTKQHFLTVNFPEALLQLVPSDKRTALIQVLEQDPRPSYINDPDREYGVFFGNQNIRFTVNEQTLTVLHVEQTKEVLP